MGKASTSLAIERVAPACVEILGGKAAWRRPATIKRFLGALVALEQLRGEAPLAVARYPQLRLAQLSSVSQ
jgi:hypothetical protein